MLDDEAELARCLRSVARQRVPHEVIVVDGGSSDGSPDVARGSGARLVQSDRAQRAAQMNAGAAAARGRILLFLHADTMLGDRALRAVVRAARSGAVGGGFARRYDSRSLVLAVTSRLADGRCRATGWFLGDQAIWIRADAFAKLGGYREMDEFEDLDFSMRMARLGRTALLHPPAVSSARRFARRGALRQTLEDAVRSWRFIRRARRCALSGCPPPAGAAQSAPDSPQRRQPPQ